MISLPTLGMGCAGIGNLYRAVEESVVEATVAAALDAGIGYFDVAPHYGFGLAETRLGRALAAHDPQQRALVSTKVGRLLEPTDSTAAERHGFVDTPPLEPVFDYSGDAILRSHEGSLQRLRRDRIDVLLAHDLGELTHGADHPRHLAAFLDSGYAAMRRLRDEGAVGAIGIGVNEIAICETLLDRVELDVILLAGRFTLLEPDAAGPLLDRCARLGTKVIVGGPYNSGILIDGSARAASSHFNYAAPDAEVIARVTELEALCVEHGVPLPAAALQFPLRDARIACVIPGMVGTDQVAATLRFAKAAVPDALWRTIHANTKAVA
jgi:D-threo-aldose 1-dehydrogenase